MCRELAPTPRLCYPQIMDMQRGRPDIGITNKGFALVELLFLVGVIVLAAAFIFPLLPHPEKDPTQPLCMSNLSRIGRAILQYAQDYDGTFPTATRATFGFPDARPEGQSGWLAVLDPYLPSRDILHCPAQSVAGVTYAANGGRRKDWDGFDSVWGLHSWWGGKYVYSYAAKTSDIASPGNTILAFDIAKPLVCPSGGGLGDVNSGWYGGFFGQFDSAGEAVKSLHTGGMNFVFCDGHGEWFSVVGHPGWNAPKGYIHPPVVRDPSNCANGARHLSIDISMADWREKRISFRRDYKP